MAWRRESRGVYRGSSVLYVTVRSTFSEGDDAPMLKTACVCRGRTMGRRPLEERHSMSRMLSPDQESTAPPRGIPVYRAAYFTRADRSPVRSTRTLAWPTRRGPDRRTRVSESGWHSGCKAPPRLGAGHRHCRCCNIAPISARMALCSPSTGSPTATPSGQPATGCTLSGAGPPYCMFIPAQMVVPV